MARVRTIRNIAANAGVRAWYKKKLLDLNDSLNRSIGWWVMAEIRKGSSPARVNDMMRRLRDRWEKRLEEEGEELARSFANRTARAVRNGQRAAFLDFGFDVPIRNTRQVMDILNNVRYTQVDLIRSMAARTLDDVARVVRDSVQTGRDIAAIKDALIGRFGVSVSRAKTIAVDQTNKATCAIREAHDVAAGITEGVWDHVPGRKESRPTHVAMNGKRFLIVGPDRGLYDKAVGRKVMPGELVLCACGYRAVLPF